MFENKYRGINYLCTKKSFDRCYTCKAKNITQSDLIRRYKNIKKQIWLKDFPNRNLD